MSFDDISNRAGPDIFAHAPIPFFAVALVAHHRGDLLFFGRLCQRAGLGNIMTKGLLAKHMLAVPEGQQGCRRMVMVRSRHKDSIDFLVHGVEHLPVIRKGPGRTAGIRDFSCRRVQMRLINIHQRDHLFAQRRLKTGLASASAADHGHRQFGIR